MDRRIVYPGQVPLETDLLESNKNVLIGIGKLAAAILGTNTLLNGLACQPTAPASMNVEVLPGEIYALDSIDATAYGSIAADTTRQILKQGILLDKQSFALAAPVTSGNSINYLIQVGYRDQDTDAVVLPYYNASNPAQAYSGPDNSGATQATRRKGACLVSVKTGTSAPTGSQVTPTPDPGYLGAWVVTVAQGQSTIVSGNISQYAGAPFIATRLPQLAPLASPVFTGNPVFTGSPTAPTLVATDNDNHLATTAFAQKMMQQAPSIVATAGGTADALTASYTPAVAALTNGMALYVRAASANATTTPTFTPNSGTIAAKTIVKGAGVALTAGDIAGAGHWIELQYDAILDKWVLLNPATGVTAQSSKQIQTVGASVAANAMTVTLNPTSLDFRSATANSGTVNTRTVGSQLSLTIPSTATLGTVSGITSRLLILAIDNAGTVELAVYNAAGGANLDETGVIDTTAIAAGSNSLTVYSQTARTGVPYRIVGFVDSTQATAGTWATAPSAVQGIGGQALAAMSSIGYGQTWQSVARTTGTTYYNTTGKPIILAVEGTVAPGGSMSITVQGQRAAHVTNGQAQINAYGISAVIPPGSAYVVAGTAISSANELR